MLQSIISVVLVGAVAVAIGFRSTDATVLEWLAALGLLALFAAGPHLDRGRHGPGQPERRGGQQQRDAADPAAALSSAFVPVDAMPGWFQPIAEYQPFTPAIETLRGLLLGTEIGHNGWLAVAWCLGLDGPRLLLVHLEVQPRPEVTARRRRTPTPRRGAPLQRGPIASVSRCSASCRDRPAPRSKASR